MGWASVGTVGATVSSGAAAGCQSGSSSRVPALLVRLTSLLPSAFITTMSKSFATAPDSRCMKAILSPCGDRRRFTTPPAAALG